VQKIYLAFYSMEQIRRYMCEIWNEYWTWIYLHILRKVF